ncbi:unnamed protein product, partial [Phaeothamnion confervicola]
VPVQGAAAVGGRHAAAAELEAASAAVSDLARRGAAAALVAAAGALEASCFGGGGGGATGAAQSPMAAGMQPHDPLRSRRRSEMALVVLQEGAEVLDGSGISAERLSPAASGAASSSPPPQRLIRGLSVDENDGSPTAGALGKWRIEYGAGGQRWSRWAGDSGTDGGPPDAASDRTREPTVTAGEKTPTNGDAGATIAAVAATAARRSSAILRGLQWHPASAAAASQSVAGEATAAGHSGPSSPTQSGRHGVSSLHGNDVKATAAMPAPVVAATVAAAQLPKSSAGIVGQRHVANAAGGGAGGGGGGGGGSGGGGLSHPRG